MGTKKAIEKSNEKTVAVYDGEVRAGTWLIAKGFEREHASITKLITNNIEEFEYFSELGSKKHSPTGGRPVVEYLLNENQAMLLGTYLRNTPIVKLYKRKLIEMFSNQKELLWKLKAQQSSSSWTDARLEGKVVRLEATDVIQKFTKYADEQGSKNSQMYFMNLTKMMNGLLFIVNGKFKNLRDVLTTRQLMTISSAEQIIEKALIDGMEKDTYYKEVYKLAKKRVALFAELHGQSEVVDKALEMDLSEDTFFEQLAV